VPKLLFTTSSFDLANFRQQRVVEASGYELVMNPFGRRLTEAEVTKLLSGDVVGMVAGVEPLTAAALRSAPALRVLVRCGAGLDNVDLEAARSLGIRVHSTPDAPSEAVAELAAAHILSLARRIPACDRAMRAGRWQPMMGSLLSRQTVGIVGLGRIGVRVARILAAFGSRVIAYDTEVRESGPVQIVPLAELLACSDIVTLHVPLNESTRGLFGANEIAAMKDGALIVNVARGGIVDEEALIDALRSGKLAGAAVDCFETEPYTGPLLGLENVQLSAHMGSYARETRALMEAEACETLVAGLRGLSLL
jgi:D-3-phosphoglycerate dehydrogenase